MRTPCCRLPLKHILFTALASLLTLSSASARVEPIERLEPVDESKGDSSFADFKAKLTDAIKKKDVSFIKTILSENVRYSFGEESENKKAPEGFIESYKLEKVQGDKFWVDLQEVLTLGCTKSPETFTCPYVFSKWPDKFESFEYIAVTRKKASIKARPSPTAPEIKSASYEILKLAGDQPSPDWFAIDFGNKKVGYLQKAEGRSAIDYRAEFKKTPSGWRMTYFIAGD